MRFVYAASRTGEDCYGLLELDCQHRRVQQVCFRFLFNNTYITAFGDWQVFFRRTPSLAISAVVLQAGLALRNQSVIHDEQNGEQFGCIRGEN